MTPIPILLTALLYASATWRTASACHAGMARDVAQAVIENAEEGSGVDVIFEGSGLADLIDHNDTVAVRGGDDCLLLSYKCPAGEDCVLPTEDVPAIRSCGDHTDYSLRVANGDGPYESIRCLSGAWYTPSGKSLDSTLAKNPVIYCQRFVPAG